MEARDELIRILTLYRDATSTPITIVFDGAGKSAGTEFPSTPDLEILYSRSGQTADQIIERVAARMSEYGEVLAVTDDYAERDTVFYQGGMASSCANFIETVERPCKNRNATSHGTTAAKSGLQGFPMNHRFSLRQFLPQPRSGSWRAFSSARNWSRADEPRQNTGAWRTGFSL
jgi:predicted RNA-binding protein with PIN domain